MDLEQLVQEGRFREDLYYRINTVHIVLPALRERKEDIVPLAQMFLERFAEKYHRPLTGIASDAAAMLTEGRWSGNIRELQNCIEKAVILSDGNASNWSRLPNRSGPPSRLSMRPRRKGWSARRWTAPRAISLPLPKCWV